ncbi:MAG TPA: hypothetical protein VM580_17645 [Labilithrix sp.]|nr:hypothetical protein [Labilithrix sp.]
MAGSSRNATVWFARLALAALLAMLAVACNNMLTGSLTPVPPVHRLPVDVAGAVVLIDRDPIIETKDPNHVARANEQRVPQDYREAMERALVLGGFKVTSKATDPHDLVARLAIAVTESGDDIRQVYRCGLFAPDASTNVAQIDWAWPKGTYVEVGEVFAFATHNVATEVATSRRVLAFLRSRREGSGSGSASDASAP